MSCSLQGADRGIVAACVLPSCARFRRPGQEPRRDVYRQGVPPMSTLPSEAAAHPDNAASSACEGFCCRHNRKTRRSTSTTCSNGTPSAITRADAGHRGGAGTHPGAGTELSEPLLRFLNPERGQLTRCDTRAVSEDPDFVQLAADEPLPFANESFDAVVALEVLEHMPADKRRPFMAESLRVARHGAAFQPNGVPEVSKPRRSRRVFSSAAWLRTSLFARAP